MRNFIFGVEYSPWWFLQKVDIGEVEYIKSNGVVKACRFYLPNGREKEIYTGQMITSDMLYTEEPKRNQPNEMKYIKVRRKKDEKEKSISS